MRSKTGFFSEPMLTIILNKEGCYLKEAAVTYKDWQMIDELMTLRKFRDSYLALQDGGQGGNRILL